MYLAYVSFKYKTDCIPTDIDFEKLKTDYQILRKKQREQDILRKTQNTVKPIVDLD